MDKERREKREERAGGVGSESYATREDRSESLRKYTPRTDMGTLLRLRPLIKELGLDSLLRGEAKNTEVLGAVLKALWEANRLNEFCRIISGTNDNFLGAVEVGTVMWLISDFFDALWRSMPGIWRQKAMRAMEILVEIGKEKIGGMIPKTGTSEPSVESAAETS